MDKLRTINQHTIDLGNGDKYFMSPNMHGDKADPPWKLHKTRKQPESIKSRKKSLSTHKVD